MERSKIKIAGSLVLSSLILLGSVWATPAEARGGKRAHNRAQQVRGHKQRPSYRNHYRHQGGSNNTARHITERIIDTGPSTKITIGEPAR